MDVTTLTQPELFKAICDIVLKDLWTIHLIREDLTLSTKRAIVSNINAHLNEMKDAIVFLDPASTSAFITHLVNIGFIEQEVYKAKEVVKRIDQ